MRSDVVIVGGGLVGLSAAYQLLRTRPGLSVTILEKESSVALHQSSRNSGVIHTGLYYIPGSYKARLCVEGRRSLIEFAQHHGVRHSICGKIIVATSETEALRLKGVHERALENKVAVKLLSLEEMKEREPHVGGVCGLLAPDAGVIDFSALANTIAREIPRMGGEILLNAKMESATHTGKGWILEGSFPLTHASYVVNCAGLHSDTVARKFGDRTAGRIIPFRGEYYTLRESARRFCNALIYPVPDLRYPFIGAHFNRKIDGSVECGPNAVLALAREGYSWRDINVRDLFRMARSRGFRRLVKEHWRMGCGEMYRSLSRTSFLQTLQRLVPEVTKDDLIPIRSGVWAQEVRPDGALQEDFSFKESSFVLHVTNASSPAATSCLEIGNEISHRALEAMER